MAQKRIKMVRQDLITNRIRLLYDDGTQGEIVLDKDESFVRPESLIGLTLKQAKLYLGIKN